MQASVHEAKANLPTLLEAVARVERVVITPHGIPDAELIAARPSRIKLGGLKSLISPPPDCFFEPLSQEELRDWEGE
ncbi:type II toxin-antitoxin system Phd/YefM family antitoxin [Fontisubflavum oceani]|uniref:type II toxin-antitoxin system Phd/YefM family antitoxin n=1 Tax=Fontisubflavum oceani TaxID=2978973 RepID=UPI0038B3CB14